MYYVSDDPHNERFPRNSKDGEAVFRGTESYYRDAGLTSGKTHYYSIFRINNTGTTSLPVLVKEVPKEGLTEVPQTPSSEIPLPFQLRAGKFTSEPNKKQITLSWKNPDNLHFLGVQIVRNTEALPANPFDGDVLYRGREEIFNDSGLVPGKRYLYGIFPFNWDNAFYSGSFTSGTPEDAPKPFSSSFVLSPVPTLSTEKEIVSAIQLQINSLQELVKNLVFSVQKLLREKFVLPPPRIVQVARTRKTHIIRITEEGFIPTDIVIKKGDTVLFVQEGLGKSWPASEDHPTHSTYPVPGGCIGSIFDSCRTLSTGDEYSFLFNETGIWEYHNHLESLQRGVITVQ